MSAYAIGGIRRINFAVPALARPYLAALIAFAAMQIGRGWYATPSNAYVLLANGILHGRLFMYPYDAGNQFLNNITLHGGAVPVDGWAPLIAFLPIVAILGLNANQTLITSIFASVAVYFAYRLCDAWGSRSTPLLTAALFAGTPLWWCAEWGTEWQVGSVFAVMCSMGALCLMIERSNAVLVIALLALGAANSRTADFLALPLYAYVMSGARRRVYVIVIVLAMFAWCVWMLWFYGVPYDAGHALYYASDLNARGGQDGGPMQLRYVVSGLCSLFAWGPVPVGYNGTQWPYLSVTTHGLSLAFSSPFLALALLAGIRTRLRIALWATGIATAIPAILFYTDGSWQYEYRHALDFVPFLFVLIVLERQMTTFGKVACSWSIAVGTWVVWLSTVMT